eukprot:UN15215
MKVRIQVDCKKDFLQLSPVMESCTCQKSIPFNSIAKPTILFFPHFAAMVKTAFPTLLACKTSVFPFAN